MSREMAPRGSPPPRPSLSRPPTDSATSQGRPLLSSAVAPRNDKSFLFRRQQRSEGLPMSLLGGIGK